MSAIEPPLEIHRGDRDVVLTWSESHRSVFPARDLRLACQCAECREEFTGRLLLNPDTVAPDIRPTRIALVGGYGFQVHWSDGHHAGIYTYQYVLQLCPCAACREGRA